MRNLHGTRSSLKYKIKLNDQILDKESLRLSGFSPQKGQLKLGKTVQPNEIMQVKQKEMHVRKEQDDIFGTQKKLPLGPADYDVKVEIVK